MGLARNRAGRRRREQSGIWKGIDLVVSGDVDAPASRDAGIEPLRAGHQFVRAAAGVNHGAGVTIVTVQALITFGADYPHDHVVGAIGGSHEGRAATALAHGPRARDGRRIGGINAESGERAAAGAKNHIGALGGPVGGRRLDDGAAGNMPTPPAR